MAYTPLGEERLRNNRTLMETAQSPHATPTQIMLSWVMRHPNGIASPQAGSVVQVEENARNLDISLTEEHLREIDKVFPAPARKIPLAGW